MGRGNDDRTYLIEALWDPNSPQFEVLNTETPKGKTQKNCIADIIFGPKNIFF